MNCCTPPGPTLLPAALDSCTLPGRPLLPAALDSCTLPGRPVSPPIIDICKPPVLTVFLTPDCNSIPSYPVLLPAAKETDALFTVFCSVCNPHRGDLRPVIEEVCIPTIAPLVWSEVGCALSILAPVAEDAGPPPVWVASRKPSILPPVIAEACSPSGSLLFRTVVGGTPSTIALVSEDECIPACPPLVRAAVDIFGQKGSTACSKPLSTTSRITKL